MGKVGTVRKVTKKVGINRPFVGPKDAFDAQMLKKSRGINDTGIEPVEFRCVVRLDPVEEKTVGGIIIPDERRDRGQMAATDATLLAIGGNAFQDWNGRKPVAGDRVMISKYAGITREADPTDLIRVVNDKEILAVLT